MKTDRILIPLDGSEMAELAVGEALQLRRSDASTLLLLRAAEARVLPGADAIGAQIAAVQEAETYLAALKSKIEKAGPGVVETHVWYGPPASAIVGAARAHKADLIVMTTHGRSGVGRLVFGSVAESVLRGTTLPILLVRPGGAPIEPPLGQDQSRPAKGQPAVRTEALR